MNFWGKMLRSIFASDRYILVFVLLTLVLFWGVLKCRNDSKNEANLYNTDPNKRFFSFLTRHLNTAYNLFTTMITVFPLLGMFGTVRSLLELNLATEEMAELQVHFFDALTSTAWGIFFAIMFKILNAVIEYDTINQIEIVQKIIDKEEHQIEEGRDVE